MALKVIMFVYKLTSSIHHRTKRHLMGYGTQDQTPADCTWSCYA